MKNWKALILAIVLASASPALSARAASDVVLQPNAPISTVLLSPEYSKIVQGLTASFAKSGLSLQITSISSMDFGNEIMVYVSLAAKKQGESKWQRAGQLVAHTVRGDDGLYVISGLYYKPEETPPGGGGSVGN